MIINLIIYENVILITIMWLDGVLQWYNRCRNINFTSVIFYVKICKCKDRYIYTHDCTPIQQFLN